MTATPAKSSAPLVRSLFVLSLLALVISGFAQMPIFKRYYIADVPGLGWLAQFYVTHAMHYLAAVLLLGVSGYALVNYFATARRHRRLTASGLVRAGILAGLTASGILLVVRNLSGVYFAHGVIIFLNLFHLGLVMLFLATALYCLVRKKPWLQR